jgi:hypothetical protein
MNWIKKLCTAIFSLGILANIGLADVKENIKKYDIAENTPIVLKQDMSYKISAESNITLAGNEEQDLMTTSYHYSHRSHSSHSSHYSHRSHYSSY